MYPLHDGTTDYSEDDVFLVVIDNAFCKKSDILVMCVGTGGHAMAMFGKRNGTKFMPNMSIAHTQMNKLVLLSTHTYKYWGITFPANLYLFLKKYKLVKQYCRNIKEHDSTKRAASATDEDFSWGDASEGSSFWASIHAHYIKAGW